MLVQSRKSGERIMIGHQIIVDVVQIRGDRVRLGITAPYGLPIHREEIFRRIEQEDSSTAATRQQPGESPYFVECG